jgi:hypothetical protein
VKEVLTLNEQRAILGFEDVEGGDVIHQATPPSVEEEPEEEEEELLTDNEE